MKRESIKLHISPYGRASSALEKLVDQGLLERRSVGSFQRLPMGGMSEGPGHLWIAFALELDKDFVKAFRQHSTPDTRLLIMNEWQSADILLSRLLDLQIRSPHRVYVADCFGSDKKDFMAALLQRLTSAFKLSDSSDCILDAKIEGEVLHVVSPNFDRLEVPIAAIPELRNADHAKVQAFEIDEDGSFIYWPDLDLHLGWSQLQQIVDPQAARKALQKSQQFNVRYGKAVQNFREAAKLKSGNIAGLSEKQLGRIEKGECRLTSNAIEALSRAHGLTANDYLQKLAGVLATQGLRV